MRGKHRTESAPASKFRRLSYAAVAAAAVAGTLFGTVQAFAGNADPTYTASHDGLWGCIARNGSSSLLHGAVHRGHATPSSCPAGYALVVFDTAAPGKDALYSITATTSVTNWPESSGWAIDAFTRTVNLTRQHAAESAQCGGTPTCWFYTGTITDGGTFTAVAGQPTPNGTGGVLASNVTGTMNGGAKFEFYASSDAPNAANVPASATKATLGTTTSEWFKLAFPAGTVFHTPASGALTQYDWEYATPCEHWSDKVNPGDDGQSAADGNITGPTGSCLRARGAATPPPTTTN